MKKFLFLLTFLMQSSITYAYDAKIDGIYYNFGHGPTSIATVTYCTTSYNSYSGVITIPKSVYYKGCYHSVTFIGDSAFYGCSGLTSVTIPESVTSIGYGAFRDCSSLTSLTIPTSITSISGFAFYGCSGLTSLTIPNSVEYIGDAAFADCSSLTAVKVGSGNTIYDSRDNCNAIILTATNTLITGCKNTMIPSSVTSIGYGAFRDCSSLTSVTIPNSVTSIGYDAFSGCSGLTSVTIPNSVTSIRSDAFLGCNGLTSVKVESGNTIYDSRDNCNAIIQTATNTLITGCKNTMIPSSVTSIGYGAFRDCSSLTSVTIPNSVTDIGSSAFARCSGLTSLTIPNSVTSIGQGAFSGCSGLTSVTIPNSVTSIGDKAFSGCDKLHIKMLATTPPKFNRLICTSSTPVEVPFGSGCQYAKAEYWNEINIIYTVNGSTRYYPVLINFYGEKIISVNGKTDVGDGIEVEEGKVVNISVISDNIENGKVLQGVSDITSTLVKDRHYSFIVSPLYYKNRIETYAYTYPTTTIQLTESGTLVNQIGVDNLDKIESLKVSGEVNGTDILTIRKMTNLKSLDLGEATIVGGGMSYYETYTTSFNTIGDYFFKDKTNLSSVILPAHITSIKQRAFEGMSNLRSIIIPATVTEIASNAFAGCSGLENVYLDIAATTLKMEAKTFADCPVRTLYVGRPLSSNPFSGKTTLKEVTIGNGVTSIPAECFKNCSGLHSIIVPLSLTSFGTDAFSGCTSLREVHISDLKFWCDIKFAKATDNPLYYAHSLWLNGEEIKDLTFPANVTIISDYTFAGCSRLTSVTIPKTITSIGSGSFQGCIGLTSLTIPNSVTSIGSSAFSDCSGLTSVTIEDGTRTLSFSPSASSFASCPLKSLYLGRNISYDSSYSPFKNHTSLTLLTIGNSVTSIGWSAFSGCSGLTSVTIPNSVTDIGSSAFSDCSGLTSVTIEDGTRTLSFSTSASSFASCPLKSLYLGRNISHDSDYAPFRDQKSLTSLTIGNNVTYIGHSAFSGCSGLTSLTIPNSVTSIGWDAFRDCSGLTSLTIPNSVTSIGGSAFEGCSGLTSLTISNAITTIEYETFYGCSGLTAVNIPNSVTSIGNHAFSDCSSLTSVTIPNSVTSIGNHAFSDCSSLTSVTIPNSVTSIGYYAFSGCSGLSAVRISDLAAWCKIGFDNTSANPLSIAHHLILNGTEVKDLVIPSCITSIRDYAFNGGSSMTAVTIHDSVTSIGRSAFYGCSGLTSLTIPNSVTSIDYWAFSGCDNLEAVSLFCSTIGNWFSDKKNIKKIVLGDLISSIGTAFSGCTAVTEVHSLNPIPPEIVKNTFSAEAYENATLYVPSGCKTIYWLHPYWEDFSPIVEEDIATGIVSLPNDNELDSNVSREDVHEDVIYTVEGRRVQQDREQLPQGIYIINGKKVFIK